jgi:hypothetical protein
MTIIKLSGKGGELNRVVLSDEDATVEAIARAAIELIESGGALHAGDVITVTED